MSLKSISVNAILNEKDPVVYTTAAESSVASAVAEMNRHRIGSLVVKDDSKVVGIFTERDVLVRVVSAGLDPKSALVREVMTADFKFITKESSVEDVMELITEERVRHLPVMEDDDLIGMISIGDVTRWLLRAREMEAENLRKYVFSDYPG